MYTVTVIHPDKADFMGDFEVVFAGVEHDERSLKAIASDLREIARRLDDGWFPRDAS